MRRICSAVRFFTGVRHISSNAFIVRLSMTPASRRPIAVSCTAASASLRYRLFMALNLRDRSILHRRRKPLIVQSEHFNGELPEGLQLVPLDVVLVALSEAIDKNCPRAPA